MFKNFSEALLAEGAAMAPWLIAVIVVVGVLIVGAVLAVVLIIVFKNKKGGAGASSAEALLMQHDKMHSRHKQLISDFHQHKPLSEEDKRKIDERNRMRGGQTENSLQAAEENPAEQSEKND